MESNKSSKTSKKRIFLIIILVIVIIFGGMFAYFKINIGPVSSKSENVYVTISKGTTVDSLTSYLEEKGIIKNAQMAKVVAKMNGDTMFTVGQYKLNKSWGSDKIMNYLADKKNVINDQVLITFKEGIWAKDIAAKIAEKTNVTADELISLWNNDGFLKKCIKKYSFLSNDILNSQYQVKLEGYLFPNTYYFKKKTNAKEVTYVFLDSFNKEYEKLKSSIKKSGYSVHDLVKLASVVQYESKTKTDMEMIAGVFNNRLNSGMKLQSSVTVCYALYNYTDWTQCETETDVDSPYNTYEYDGLPIGPVCNPGADALYATLNPKDNDYYYFMADVCGDGTIYYAKTIEEHNANVEKYLTCQ